MYFLILSIYFNFKYRLQEENPGARRPVERFVPLTYFFPGRGLDLYEDNNGSPGRPRKGNVVSINLQFAKFLTDVFINSKDYAM